MENLPKNILIAILITVAGISIPIATYYFLRFPDNLNSDEKSVYNFTPSPLQLSPKTWQNRTHISPLSETFEKSSEKAALLSLTEQKQPAPQSIISEPLISFILQESGKSMAILDGFVVREGDSVHGWRIAKIESNRVLLNGKRGSRWIKID